MPPLIALSFLSCSSFYRNAKPGSDLDVSPQRDSDVGCYELIWFSGAYPHRAPLSFRLLPDAWGEVGISPAWEWATKHAKDLARDHVAVTRQMTFDNGCRFMSWRPEDDAHAKLVIREGSCCGMTLSLTRTAEGLDAHIDQFDDVVRPEPLPPVGDAVYRKITCKDPEWYPPAWMAGDLCVQPAGR
ncbi:MAG: hypothetical protein KC933_25690 [Myxococcales bacterium]|nr:hypothetical protein [Myxococcales bacterium]MCB9651558.1 hypothetical protein [Deltaproteobacteria bacterium]